MHEDKGADISKGILLEIRQIKEIMCNILTLHTSYFESKIGQAHVSAVPQQKPAVNSTDISTQTSTDFIFPKKTAKVKDTSKDLLDRNIPTNNYFGPLAFINNEPPVELTRSGNSSGNHETKNIHRQVNSPKPSKKRVPIVPGTRTYSEAHQTKVAIVSDSMSGQLRANTVNSYLRGEEEKAIISKNPGATARKLKHNSIFVIEEEDPDVLVVIAGVNDILYGGKKGKNVNEHTVAKDVMDIARQGKEMGVRTIYVSGIITMANSRLDRIRHRVNILLEAFCLDEGFIYLSHDNISKTDLCSDNLHLSRNGIKILMDNILGCCFTMYNPYIADFYDSII